MKNLFSFIFFSMFCLNLVGQDYIVKRDGSEVYGIIKELTLSHIVYTDTLPTDTLRKYLSKAEVFLVKYRNGVKEIFNETIKENEEVLLKSSNGIVHMGPIVDMGSNDYAVNGQIKGFGEIKLIMMSLEDREINSLLVKVRLAGFLGNFLSFASIPAGVISIMVGLVGVVFYSPEFGFHSLIIGTTCISLNVSSGCLTVIRSEKLKRAISLYNEKIASLK